MTTSKIEKEAQKALLPFKLAAQIRATLDQAKAESKTSAEEWSDVEAKVLELVADEG